MSKRNEARSFTYLTFITEKLKVKINPKGFTFYSFFYFLLFIAANLVFPIRGEATKPSFCGLAIRNIIAQSWAVSLFRFVAQGRNVGAF